MNEEHARLRELAALALRLGTTAFGGPAAHVAMLHDEVVTRRAWLDDRRFVDMLGATSLVPGPNSTEMVMHVGHVRAGVRGLVLAGACFILPAAAIVLAFAWAYMHYGDTPGGEALLYGIKPVVVIIIVQALVKLGRAALDRVSQALLAAAAVAAYLVGINEIAILAAGAVIALALRGGRRARSDAVHGLLLMPLAVASTLGSGRVVAVTAETLGLWRLFAIFLKIGAVLYGSGYVLLAFLRTDLVERLDVLTSSQLIDAVAVGQFTPGPVFTTATFIGYVLGGFAGAVVATIGIFLPAFVFVGLLTRILPHIRDRWWSAALLDGVNAAALGLMAGVLAILGQDAIADPPTVALAAATSVALWRTNLNSAWLIAGGGAAGLLAGVAGAV